MTVYVVGYTTAYEGGDIQAVYSTRELAEASWEMRSQEKWGFYEIMEFELDLDPNADKEDVDRRPVEGPRTFAQHKMNEMYSRICLSMLTSPSPLSGCLRDVPPSDGKIIKFFS